MKSPRTERDGSGESAVAISEKYAYDAVVEVGNRDVGFSIAIKVADRGAFGT